MSDESPHRVRLRQELLRARDRAGLSGRQMAERLGVSQGTLWRIEQGRQLASLPRVEAWVEACGLDREQRQRILDLAELAHGETRPWRELLDVEGHLQAVSHEREQTATLVRNFQPTIIPGLLQSPEYARRVLEAGHTRDVDGAVTARMERQRALREGDTEFVFLIGERALRAAMGGDDTLMADQSEQLLATMELESVTVGVVPDGAPVLAWHNFIIWVPVEGDLYVTTELVHGSQEIMNAEDALVYVRAWHRLEEAARFGDDARALISETAAGWRRGRA